MLTGPTWTATRKVLRTVAYMWDTATNSPISFDVFFARTPRIQDKRIKWLYLSTAVAALPLLAAPSSPRPEPGLLLHGQWLPCSQFGIGKAIFLLADAAQNPVQWWQQVYGLDLPSLPRLHKWLMTFTLPPQVRQTMLLYAAGALALRCKCYWIPEADKVCPCCALATDDFNHFPSQCLGLHNVFMACNSLFPLLGLPNIQDDNRTFIQTCHDCVTCHAAASHSLLLALALYLQTAWRVRLHYVHATQTMQLPQILHCVRVLRSTAPS